MLPVQAFLICTTKGGGFYFLPGLFFEDFKFQDSHVFPGN